jgi:hypothetical protein
MRIVIPWQAHQNEGKKHCMIEIDEIYRFGGLCVRLKINSMQKESVEQLRGFLMPLLPFRSNDCNVENWNLSMADFEFESNAKSLTSLFSPSDSKYANVITHEDRKQFFVVSNDQRILTPERILFSVMLLATWWHVLNGGLCLHAAAVSRNKQGFLFLGKSGAGKSTLSTLSSEIGIPVLAEDRVFLLNQHSSYMLAAGPHPTTEYVHYSNLRPNLRGIFILEKDRTNYIKPTPHSKAAKYLFAAFLQNSASSYLPASAMDLAFKTISCIARQIPTFELHFRKSPDFWRLIDERFPD